MRRSILLKIPAELHQIADDGAAPALEPSLSPLHIPELTPTE